MKIFNAFQLTLLFACWPFIITWIRTQEFYASGTLVWVCIAAYIFHFGATVAVYVESMDK